MEQTELYRPMNCIVCDKEIKQIYEGTKDKPYNGCWDGGVVEICAMGYGSDLDGDKYLICVCDECMKFKLSVGMVDYIGNYLGL